MTFFKHATARSPGSEAQTPPLSEDDELIARYEALFGRTIKSMLRTLRRHDISVETIALCWGVPEVKVQTWIVQYGLDTSSTSVPKASQPGLLPPTVTPAQTHSAILTRLIEHEGSLEAAKTFLHDVLSTKRTMGAAAAHCKIAHESVFGKINPQRFAILLDEVEIPRTTKGKGKPGGPGGSKIGPTVPPSISPPVVSTSPVDAPAPGTRSAMLQRLIDREGSLEAAKAFITLKRSAFTMQLELIDYLQESHQGVFGKISAKRLRQLLTEMDLPLARGSVRDRSTPAPRVTGGESPRVPRPAPIHPSPGARSVARRPEGAHEETTDQDDHPGVTDWVVDHKPLAVSETTKEMVNALCKEQGISLGALLTQEYVHGRSTAFTKAYAMPLTEFFRVVRAHNGGTIPAQIPHTA